MAHCLDTQANGWYVTGQIIHSNLSEVPWRITRGTITITSTKKWYWQCKGKRHGSNKHTWFFLWQFLICFWVGHHRENMRDLLKVFVLRFTTETLRFIRCFCSSLQKLTCEMCCSRSCWCWESAPARLATMSFRALDRNCPWCIHASEHLFRVNRSVNWQLRRKFLNNSEQSDKMVHASLETSVSSRPISFKVLGFFQQPTAIWQYSSKLSGKSPAWKF